MAKQPEKIIGRKKYEALKALDLENITDETIYAFELQFKGLSIAEGLKMIKSYEEKSPTAINHKSIAEYSKKLKSEPKEPKKIEMTKEWLWKEFSINFRAINKKPFEQNSDSIENIKPLIFYFIGDLDNFKQCKNVSDVSEPSLSKGLLIIGGYGNGKTAIMAALEKTLSVSNIRFKGYTTNQIVNLYEACSSPVEKEEFYRKMKTGTLYFDDVLTEREASNFGKNDVIKEILEERYSRQKRTYISLNYLDGSGNDLEIGLQQIGQRYGSRLYDRIFDMFNVIEFTGKSFRR